MTPEQLLANQNIDEEERREAWEKMMTQQERKEVLEETPEDLREHISDEILMQPPQKWEELPQQLRELAPVRLLPKALGSMKRQFHTSGYPIDR